MIEVENLVKQYAGYRAVQGISFQVDRGEVVGFLGPNGAGKSTTMKILTTYLAPTSGKVKICGLDVLEDSLGVRRRIGYMPENVPLYGDMRVEEYLSYRAALKGMRGMKSKQRLGSVMEQCGVSEVRRRLIHSLSKGYRQRVGLADALMHNPELLILDEPTAGLDPHQIRSVRQLIQEVGRERTVLLSTHILSEVEAVCSRALIIHRGKIEASDTIENLSKKIQSGSVWIEVDAAKESALEKLQALPEVAHVYLREEKKEEGKAWLTIECQPKPGEDIRLIIDSCIKREGWPLRELRRERATLEDVFVELTQE